jgi:hypothetical protein
MTLLMVRKSGKLQMRKLKNLGIIEKILIAVVNK